MHYLGWSGLEGTLKKEVGLGNTLPSMVEDSKARSKGGRVRKHTTFDG
jgi:hypothetical protein